ncbi:Fc.00g080980.m01.CDS01 [Cosmosporella sp. VM-42]
MSMISAVSGEAGSYGHFATGQFMDPDDIRTAFTLAMSSMYRDEVPLYGDLVRIVRDVNNDVFTKQSGSDTIPTKFGDVAPARLDLERHGAVRLGTPYELRTIRRLFKVIGLQAVGYYDLSVAGLPMHATCFRPIDTASLHKNPFRVFTTLLRPELLQDKETKQLAMDLLTRREIFSPELLQLLQIAEEQHNRLTPSQAETFVVETMKTFSWRPVASASEEEYKKLATEHPILADIASFRSSHINHLTPRTLDITATQERMKLEGLRVKHRIEGPPARKCPILLRQTSFLALEESIKFQNSNGILVEGTHIARFGEVEERGAAVTPAGRRLYDELLTKTMERWTASSSQSNPNAMDNVLTNVFRAYPDDWAELRSQGLVYCTYLRTRKEAPTAMPVDSPPEALVSQGLLEAEPITYEDFLPFSAAGIFQSNLRPGSKATRVPNQASNSDLEGFESALGRRVLDSDALYLQAQNESLRKCALSVRL